MHQHIQIYLWPLAATPTLVQSVPHQYSFHRRRVQFEYECIGVSL